MNNMTRSDELVAQWRASADASNPAGPLFIGGEFAEADIVCETTGISGKCGTGCTGSITRICC